MGNSEVGHTNIGGGRVVFQDLPRISRGMKETEMTEIGGMIVRLIKEGESAVSEVKDQVIDLCERFPLYPEM